MSFLENIAVSLLLSTFSCSQQVFLARHLGQAVDIIVFRTNSCHCARSLIFLSQVSLKEEGTGVRVAVRCSYRFFAGQSLQILYRRLL